MPYVNIRVAGALNKDQKTEISAKVTELIVKVTGKPANSVLIFIDELPYENIAIDGKLLQTPAK